MVISSLALALLTSVPHPADPIPPLLAAVDSARLKADVERLVAFHTRHSLSETDSDERGIGAARRWLEARLRSISVQHGGRLEVFTQTFSVTLAGREVEMVNVVGHLRGTLPAERRRVYVVSGHYDSRASDGMDGEAFAPGADDDASGTAVVLELARVMAGETFPADIYFLCVAGEEQGLYGAKHFAAWCGDEGLVVDGMITNDIVGGIEGGNGVVDDRTVRCFSFAEDGLHSPSRELARALQASARRYVPDVDVELIFRLDRFGRGGDHIPFQQAGLPALRLSEANENYARQHQDVREEGGMRYGDLPEFVSGEYMARVARVNGAVLAELALAPAPPREVRMRAAVSYDTQLSWEPSPGAVAYEIVWRKTTQPQWTGRQRVEATVVSRETAGGRGERLRATVKGVTADGAFFGVRALSPQGQRSRVAYPARP